MLQRNLPRCVETYNKKFVHCTLILGTYKSSQDISCIYTALYLLCALLPSYSKYIVSNINYFQGKEGAILYNAISKHVHRNCRR